MEINTMVENEILSDDEEKSIIPVNKKRKILKNDPEMVKERKEKAIKAMKYLFKNSLKYSYFMQRLNPTDIVLTDNNLDDFDKLKYEEKDVAQTVIAPKLKYFTGDLYDYQVVGFKWLKLLFDNSVNGILADEMGLGKTVQVIALIADLMENRVPGPYLIIAPLSTLHHWLGEFKRFAPKIPAILFHNKKDDIQYIQNQINRKYYIDKYSTYPVVITAYHYIISYKRFLQKFKWQYIVIDEGHRIKNFECKLNQTLKEICSLNRLLLTGTPLQNNLLELWSLLNFLHPETFNNQKAFADLFEIEDFNKTDAILEQEQNTNIISTIHGILEPFMLRRLKSDVLHALMPKKEVLVYCPLSELQNSLYKYVLQKNINMLLGKEEEIENGEPGERKKRACTFKKINYNESVLENSMENIVHETKKSDNDFKSLVYYIKMANPAMMLKKIVNHPFTVHCPIDKDKKVIINEDIVTCSGKMMVLDAMLTKLKADGHKVLLFCTLTLVLDFIEDFVIQREYKYCRLDGSITNLSVRQKSIDDFNNDPNIFIFLISTRAGGLGINLTAADTVILFDRDWNPQVDIQAQERCHRIGQTKPVMIYSLITKGTIEERILTFATAKRKLEKIVIKKGLIKPVIDLKELEELLNSVDHNAVIHTNESVFTEEELSLLLDRSELNEEMKKRNNNA